MQKRVLIGSSSLLAVPTLESLQRSDSLDLVGLLTTPDRPKGRHGTPSPNELVEYLAKDHVPVWKPETSSDLLDVIQSVKPDLVVVIAYGRLIKKDALDRVPLGWINLHFSLLPAYRGAAPVQRAILNGDEAFGVTVFRIDEGMDTGPVLLREKVGVDPQWNATEILDHLAQNGVGAINSAIDLLLRGKEAIEQSGPGSLAPKVDKKELRLDLQAQDFEVIRQIRAFTQTPGVWFIYRGRRHILTSARKSEAKIPRGRLAHHHGKALIGLRESAIEVLSIIPEGRREISGGEWLRGLRLADGEVSDDGVEL